VTEPNTLPSIDFWRPNQLQLVVFPITSPVDVDESWWRRATGEEPAESSKKRYEITITGPYGGGNLVLTVDQLRIIWTLTPYIDALNPPLTMPTIGFYPGSRDIFIQLMRPWVINHCPKIKRMAVTGLLMQEEKSHDEAYYLLQRYLQGSVKIDPESTDFMYRVNRPQFSRTSAHGLRVNRLATWSAIKFSVAHLTFLVGSEGEGATFKPTTGGYGVVLQCDVNTDAERAEEIPHETVAPLFDELIDLTSGIAANGDVA
jgi:hypothetical protein